jgi:hypothetical protein
MTRRRRVLFPAAMLLLAGMATVTAEPAPSFPDRSQAFGGVAFGASVAEAREQWELEEVDGAAVPDDPVSIFLREEESHVLGGVRARELIYYFVDDKFYAVGLSTPDSRQTTILREALELGYGAPPHRTGGGASLVWPGEAVSAQLLVNPATGEGRLLLFSNDLQPAFEQSLREAAARTAAGL